MIFYTFFCLARRHARPALKLIRENLIKLITMSRYWSRLYAFCLLSDDDITKLDFLVFISFLFVIRNSLLLHNFNKSYRAFCYIIIHSYYRVIEYTIMIRNFSVFLYKHSTLNLFQFLFNISYHSIINPTFCLIL